MAKKLSKILWHDTKVDGAGKPVLPSVATDEKGLNGLLPGELFMHVGKEKVSLWALSLSGEVVEVSGKTGEVDIDLSDYLLKSVWDSVFEIKTDVSGQKYIFGKLPVVTKYGITMYADDGNVDIPQLAEGLPFDQRTIWFNPETKQIEVIGGTGGGSEGGVSNFWDLSGIPSWITSTKPKYSYSEIEGTPDLSGYATTSALNAVSTKLNDFLEGSDTDTVINKWKELETFLSGLTESDNLATILTGKADKSYVDTNFVTIAGTEDVTGLHNFVNGLKVGGIELIQKNGNVFLKGSLVVEGGITMYGDGEGGSSVPLYSTLGSLENVDKDSIDAVASVDRVLFQSAGSNVWSWKALSEIGGSSSGGGSVSGDYLPLTGGSLSGMLTITTNLTGITINNSVSTRTPHITFQSNGKEVGAIGISPSNIPQMYNASKGTWHTILTDDNYSRYALPLSGGTLSNGTNTPLNIKGIADGSWIAFYNQSDAFRGSIGFQADNQPYAYHTDYGACQILHSGNYSSYALPLSGGTLNGTLFVNDSTVSTIRLNTTNTDCGISFKTANSSSNRGWIGFSNQYGVSLYNYNSKSYGFAMYDNGNVALCHDKGNVGIGTPDPSNKLSIVHNSTSDGDMIKLKSNASWSGIVFNAASGYTWSINASTSNDFYLWNSYFSGRALTLSHSGNLLIQGGMTMYSDQRKKTILNHVELSLKQIADAPLIEHYYNSDQEKTTHVGSIAQYWANLNDWFCKLDAEGFYTMEIQNCALASAISIARHLEKYETKTDKTIRKMKQRIQELEDEVERLKKGA